MCVRVLVSVLFPVHKIIYLVIVFVFVSVSMIFLFSLFSFLLYLVKCSRRRRPWSASRLAMTSRKKRTLPSGRECLSTPCARCVKTTTLTPIFILPMLHGPSLGIYIIYIVLVCVIRKFSLTSIEFYWDMSKLSLKGDKVAKTNY